MKPNRRYMTLLRMCRPIYQVGVTAFWIGVLLTAVGPVLGLFGLRWKTLLIGIGCVVLGVLISQIAVIRLGTELKSIDDSLTAKQASDLASSHLRQHGDNTDEPRDTEAFLGKFGGEVDVAKKHRKSGEQGNAHCLDAVRAFATAKRIWQEALRIEGDGWRERRLPKIEEALKYLDEAIEKGVERTGDSSEVLSLEETGDDSEAFRLRGDCLDDLEFYFEALEDYNEAIKRKPRRGIASTYHQRSIIKSILFDYEGSLVDLKEAIRLSKLDNDDNGWWNKYAQSTGFASATVLYEMDLESAERRARRGHLSDEHSAKQLKTIKRRSPQDRTTLI